MELSAIHEKQDDIPEQYRDLYTEKAGKWELTGIRGVKTQADVERVQLALTKEKNEHKETKAKLSVWGDMDHDEVTKSLDRLPELEAAAGDKLDDSKIDELATKRAEGMIKTRLAPIERDNVKLKKENEEMGGKLGALTGELTTRKLRDGLREHLVTANVDPHHYDDVFMYAERHLEAGDDGNFFARDGVDGITAGSTPKDWLEEMLPKRPGWLPPSEGGGARGNDGRGGFSGPTNNPWSREHWNVTAQGAYMRENGEDKAKKAASAAGSKVDAIHPPEKT